MMNIFYLNKMQTGIQLPINSTIEQKICQLHIKHITVR